MEDKPLCSLTGTDLEAPIYISHKIFVLITRQNLKVTSYLIFICQMGLFICPFSHHSLQIFRELNN